MSNQWKALSLEHFIIAALIMTTILHALAATSRMHCGYILATLQAVLYGAFVWCNTRSTSSTAPGTLTPDQAALLSHIPDDVRGAIKDLGLEPDIVRHACCPDCFATYPPDPSCPDDPFPHNCTFQETDKPVCGRQLVFNQRHVEKGKKKARVTYEPILSFPFRPVQSYIRDMANRPGLVSMLKSAWTARFGSRWTNIFHTPGVRNFLGPDGKTPFSVQPENGVHLVFSLFIDWFSPYGNKQAGKSHSIGVIYLICQNLPDHLRYRPENICLFAIIPGPKEPELHQMNHLLRPLVDELLVLWRHGIMFTTTSTPVFVRAAVIPLVCDLPALRKAAGFMGHMAKHFCSFCKLSKKQINNLDRDSWERLSWEQHLHFAAQWRDAPTEKARDDLLKAHGLRWSELLRLDYWDPTQFAVVDAMHNLFLGELRHHCREVWGIDVKDKSSESTKVLPHSPEEQRAQLLRGFKALRNTTKNGLDKLRKGYVVAIAEVNGILPKGGVVTKAAYRDALLAWVRLALSVLEHC